MKKDKKELRKELKLNKIQVSKLDNLSVIRGGDGGDSGVDWTQPTTKPGGDN